MTGAGGLDRRVVIERYTSTTGAFNESEKTWAPLTTIWAGYMPVSDGERLSSGQVNSALTARFTVRSSIESRTIDSKDRLTFDSGTWEITGVKETSEGRRRYREISATRQSD